MLSGIVSSSKAAPFRMCRQHHAALWRDHSSNFERRRHGAVHQVAEKESRVDPSFSRVELSLVQQSASVSWKMSRILQSSTVLTPIEFWLLLKEWFGALSHCWTQNWYRIWWFHSLWQFRCSCRLWQRYSALQSCQWRMSSAVRASLAATFITNRLSLRLDWQ